MAVPALKMFLLLIAVTGSRPAHASNIQQHATNLEVTTDKGIVKGQIIEGLLNFQYGSFQGIPYAKPPVGALRFKAPEPAEPWEGVLPCLETRNECAQPMNPLGGPLAKGNEDCLYINVYRPAEDTKDLLSVMVWIHGGAYYMGNGHPFLYGPEFLVSKGIVLVTLNYRLGALGFLWTGNKDAPGNNGLKDQRLALQWVQKNIKNFGGDPNSVTIFGESAGSASVHAHTLSPMNKDCNLFHRAIMQSGSLTNPWAFKEPNASLENTRALLRRLSCPEDSLSKEAIDCLRRAPMDEIVANPFACKTAEDERTMHMVTFAPTIDGEFLPAHPRDLLPHASKIPTICGFTDREGFISLKLVDDDEKIARWRAALQRGEVLPMTKPPQSNTTAHRCATNATLSYYFNNEALCKKNIDQFVIYYSDTQFISGIVEALNVRIQDPANSHFVYYFNFDGPYNFAKLLFGASGKKGASHGDELAYIFRNSMVTRITKNTAAWCVIDNIVTLLTTFAKIGRPTTDAPSDGPARSCGPIPPWEPYLKGKPAHMEIGRNLTMRGRLVPDRAEFWDKMENGVY